MNAMVNLGMNVARLSNPTLAERTDTAQQVTSLAAANILGRTGNTKALMKAGDSSAVDDTSSATNATIDQDMFLRLLVTQMQNQDPLEPMENSDMLAQLAQFSSLEQMNKLNTSFEEMSGNIDQLNFVAAGAMLGRDIMGIDQDGEIVEGTVDGVYMEEGLVHLSVDGETVSLADVQAVR